jgi:hypothetical protein
MATVIFASGLELPVTAQAPEILEYVEAAQRGGAAGLPGGWIMLTASQDTVEVAVQASQIAYIRP